MEWPLEVAKVPGNIRTFKWGSSSVRKVTDGVRLITVSTLINRKAL